MISCTLKQEQFSGNDDSSDSLEVYLTKANDKTFSKEQRLIFNQKAAAIVAEQKEDSLHICNLLKIANRYYNIKAMEDYKKTSKIIAVQAEKIKDSVHLAGAYSYLGDYYHNQLLSDSAYYYYFKAEKIYLKLKDKENIGRMHLKKSYVQYKEGDFQGSETSVFKALKYFQESTNRDMIYEAYNILGIIFNELKEYDKAIEYHYKALAVAKYNVISTVQARALSLNNLGVVYRNQEANKAAIAYFKTALQEGNLSKENPLLYAMLLDNLGYSQLKLKDYSQLPGLFYKALVIRDSLKIIPGIIINKRNLSAYYHSQKDTVKAVQFAQEAYDLAVNKGVDTRDILLALKQLSVVNPIEAAAYSSEYIIISDNLHQAERSVRNKLGRVAFETDELAIQKEKLAIQNRNIIIWFAIIMFIALLLFVIGYQQSKNKELKLKEAQQHANEEIYNLLLSQQDKIEEVRQSEKKRIAQELHDGILGRLFGTRLNLDSLNRKEGEDAAKNRNNYINELKSIEEDIREISHDLSKEKAMVTNNFVVIVEDLIEKQQNLGATKIIYYIDDTIQWETLENTIKINLYRIIQESFQNSNKYAHAKNITITIREINQAIQLIIEDDGIGFDTTKRKKGIGLQNMQSRVQSMGGVLTLISAKGTGTKIEVLIVLK